MNNLRRITATRLLVSIATVSSCGEGVFDIEETRGALSVCGETVPVNRFVDGIPAYAQCAGSENAAIYSNNGVDTSLTAMGPDWVRTQGSGGYQCTELAHRYLHFRWNITNWLPRGNAGTWCETQPTAASGVVQTTTPVHGDLIVFAPGSCGSSTSTGHVAVVDTVDTARSQVTFVEENGANRRSGAQSCGACFLHVVANNGVVVPPDGGTTSTGGGPGTGGTGGGPGTSGRGGGPGTGGTGGAAASGGVVGSGGQPSTGGVSGTGGAVGFGGASVLGTGGAKAGSGGAPVGPVGIPGGSGGASSPTGDPPGAATVGGGCACGVSGADPSTEILVSCLAALGFAPLCRRRVRRRR